MLEPTERCRLNWWADPSPNRNQKFIFLMSRTNETFIELALAETVWDNKEKLSRIRDGYWHPDKFSIGMNEVKLGCVMSDVMWMSLLRSAGIHYSTLSKRQHEIYPRHYSSYTQFIKIWRQENKSKNRFVSCCKATSRSQWHTQRG